MTILSNPLKQILFMKRNIHYCFHSTISDIKKEKPTASNIMQLDLNDCNSMRLNNNKSMSSVTEKHSMYMNVNENALNM